MGDPSGVAAPLDATVLVPTPDEPSVPGAIEVAEREVVTAALHEDGEGLAFAAFTSAAAVARWRPEGAVCVARPLRWAMELAAVGPDGRLAVDPCSPGAQVLGPAQLAAALAGPVGTGPSGAGAQVLVASPSEPLAPAVLAAVRGALAAEGSVASARHVVVDQGDGTPGPCVAVAFDPGCSAEEVELAMGRVVAAVAATTDEAGGLRFVRSDGELRAAIDGAGSEVWAR